MAPLRTFSALVLALLSLAHGFTTRPEAPRAPQLHRAAALQRPAPLLAAKKGGEDEEKREAKITAQGLFELVSLGLGAPNLGKFKGASSSSPRLVLAARHHHSFPPIVLASAALAPAREERSNDFVNVKERTLRPSNSPLLSSPRRVTGAGASRRREKNASLQRDWCYSVLDRRRARATPEPPRARRPARAACALSPGALFPADALVAMIGVSSRRAISARIRILSLLLLRGDVVSRRRQEDGHAQL